MKQKANVVYQDFQIFFNTDGKGILLYRHRCENDQDLPLFR